MSSIIFKVRSGPTIGYGHIARCKILMRVLKDKFKISSKLLINSLEDPKADIMVLDYPGAKLGDTRNEKVVLMQESLAKTKLTIIDDSILKARHNKASRHIRRILVTMGGADPYEITLKTCQYLEGIKPEGVVVDAIVGPYYAKEHIKKLKGIKSNAVINLNLHSDVKSLNKYIKQADLAITAGGVTMHECAVACLPALIVCHWPEREMPKFNNFLKKGTGLSLGHYTKLTYAKFSKEFKNILNLKTRERVFKNCKKFKGLNDKIEIARLILKA